MRPGPMRCDAMRCVCKKGRQAGYIVQVEHHQPAELNPASALVDLWRADGRGPMDVGDYPSFCWLGVRFLETVSDLAPSNILEISRKSMSKDVSVFFRNARSARN